MTQTPEEIKDFLSGYKIWFYDNGFITASSLPTLETFVLMLTEYASIVSNAKAKEAAEKAYSQAWADKDIPFVNFDNVKEQYLEQEFPEQ